jgi:hypothetical protein
MLRSGSPRRNDSGPNYQMSALGQKRTYAMQQKDP